MSLELELANLSKAANDNTPESVQLTVPEATREADTALQYLVPGLTAQYAAYQVLLVQHALEC